MAETILVASPSWNPTYRSFNGDGTATYWANSFLPLWGRVCAIAAYLRADETIPVAGATLHGYATGSGADLIGMPATALGGWDGTGGSLFDFLDNFGDTFLALADAVALKAGSTIAGPFIFAGNNARIQYRAPSDLPDTASHTMTLAYDFADIPNVSQTSIYTLPNPSAAGQWVIVRRLTVGSGQLARVVRVDNTILASFPNSGSGTVLFISESDGGSGFQWTAFMPGGVATIAA